MPIAVVRAVESTVGRETDVNAVIIIGRCLEEPAFDAIVGSKRDGCERRAAHAHSVGNDAQGHIFLGYGIDHLVQTRQFGGIHAFVANLCERVVGVFCIAH